MIQTFRRKLVSSTFSSGCSAWFQGMKRNSFPSLFRLSVLCSGKTPFRGLLIVVVSVALVLLFSNRAHPASVATTELSDKAFEEYVSEMEPSPDLFLRRPPPIIAGLTKKEATSRIQVPDHTKPCVFTAVGIPDGTSNSSHSSMLLFLYSQGTISPANSDDDGFFLNITSCLVGSQRFPVIFNASGVYACRISKLIAQGENITLVLSPPPLKKQPHILTKYLASLKELDDDSVVLESEATWQGQMEETVSDSVGRYRVCMMTQEKVFPEYIPEWVSYHRRIGVDYVYIYDNGAKQNLSEKYKDATDVEVVDWPWKRSQIQAQNHFLLTGRRRCQWAVMIDVDEYIMLRPRWPASREQPLKKYLRLMREVRDFSQIRVTSVVLGSSGHIYRPKAPLAEAYWHYSNMQDNLTKPIVWLGHTLPDSDVHRVRMAKGFYSHVTKSAFAQPQAAEIALCHMKYRSWEDYVLKGQGGRNSFRVNEWAYSSNWSIDSPNRNHLTIRNAGTFTEFRKLWKRLVLYDIEPPAIAARSEIDSRYARIERSGYGWKQRKVGNSTIEILLVENEKRFRKLKR